MKKIVLILTTILIVSMSLTAQDTFYSIYSFTYFIPEVKLNTQTEQLQYSLYPLQYENRSVSGDIRWVENNDSLLAEFWTTQSDTVLHIMRELAGIEWIETKFDIYLVRYYPTLGSGEPLIIPIGGIHDRLLIEAPPASNQLKLNLLFQLSRRMLSQADRPQDDMKTSLAYHPLMQPTPYRRDNLALLLAVNTAYSVMGIDSTLDALQSAFWEKHFPGLPVFKDNFENAWILTPDHTLADWVAEEPSSSSLVSMTRPPKKPTKPENLPPRYYIENLPLKGQLGISTRITDQGQLLIDVIDVYRLGYAAGLREGDIIRRVDGKLVRNQKAMVEAILETYQKGGSIVEILRDGSVEEILIQPYDDFLYEPDYFYTPDSLGYPDSLEYDTTYIDSI